MIKYKCNILGGTYMRCVRTVIRGIRTPILKEDTNLIDTVIESLCNLTSSSGDN